MNTEIQWTDEGMSRKYVAAEAVLLMAYYRYHGDRALIVKTDVLGPRYMKRGGQIVSADVPLQQRDLEAEPYEQWYFIGCQTCHEDAPEEAECPDCGRPLDPYPHYYRYCGVRCDEIMELLYRRVDGPDCKAVVVTKSHGELSRIRKEDYYKDSDVFECITPEEARGLRERALYPRYFVCKKSPRELRHCVDGTDDTVYLRHDDSGHGFTALKEDGRMIREPDPDNRYFTADGLAEAAHWREITEEEAHDLRERDRCGKCRGGGRITGYEGGLAYVCSRCYGSGVEPEEDKPDGGEEPCPICNGHGRHIVRIGESSWETQECPECGGNSDE